VFNAQSRTWNLRRGPIFANVVLVDELNRASPKIQSAFIEAMQEKQVTIDGETLEIALPFMVVATQVPYGEAGTYPLTAVQIDRFSYLAELKYPSGADELEILGRVDRLEYLKVKPVLSLEEVQDISEQAQSIYVHSRVNEYILSLVAWLRGNQHIRSGPSPRASITLFKGSRVKAMMDGREYVTPDDVKALAASTLQHRIDLTSQARAEEITSGMLVREALASVPVPKDLGKEAK
jgi:MoxR-like ATPase